MKTNNQKKLKNKIFIIWGLFITGVILVFLIILLLAMNKPQPKVEIPNQPTLTSKTNPQQEQETYNDILRRIDKAIDELTSTAKVIEYYPDQKTIKVLEILNNDDELIYHCGLFNDGKTIEWKKEYNKKTKMPFKYTYYNPDGTVKEVINY